MRSVKETVAMLAKQEDVTIVKKCTILDVYVGDVNPETGVCSVVLNLDKQVPGMVQVTKKYLESIDEDIAEYKAKLAIEVDAEAKSLLKQKIDELKAFADSLNIDDWVEGTVNRVFISNFDVIGMLRQNPETKFLVDAVQADETVIKGLLNQATINVIAERVAEGEEYLKPFSNNDVAYQVPHDSVYHSCYNLRLSDYGEEAADNIRSILNDITRERLMNKLRRRAEANDRAKAAIDDED